MKAKNYFVLFYKKLFANFLQKFNANISVGKINKNKIKINFCFRIFLTNKNLIKFNS